MNEDTAKKSKFFLDGQEITWHYVEYSRREVARGYGTTTYEVTSLPAIVTKPTNPYYTLRIENEAGSKELLLKRDLMQGYKLFLYLDLYFSLGVGTTVDTYSYSLFALPQIDVEKIKANPAKKIYFIGGQR